MRNKYTDQALKAGNAHYTNYRGDKGYIKVIKPLSLLATLKFLALFIVLAIVIFHIFTK